MWINKYLYFINFESFLNIFKIIFQQSITLSSHHIDNLTLSKSIFFHWMIRVWVTSFPILYSTHQRSYYGIFIIEYIQDGSSCIMASLLLLAWLSNLQSPSQLGLITCRVEPPPESHFEPIRISYRKELKKKNHFSLFSSWKNLYRLLGIP